MKKIACVGIAVQDKIYYVDSIPTTGGKFVAKDYKEVGGGPAATAAVAIAKLGANVDFIGRVGDDATGATIIAELKSYGVNTDFIRIYDNARSSQSAILVDNQGERLIINYPSPDLLTETQWLEHIDFSQYDAILCDVRWHEGTEYYLKKAKQLNIPTILDADITPQDISKLVSLVDHAVFSEPGLTKLTNSTETSQALNIAKQLCKGHVYVTKGSKGCFWLEDNKEKHYDAFKVKVVDTTGAGDVFHGAFAYALAHKYTLQQTVEFATAVAALKCTMSGGRQGIPNLQQVKLFLTEQ
ncbi:sugar kinase [Basfia succiniciproducens]|uniref:sugar kinase n=1 Tax=Basfia succiniciproducens TaxID=653940 RepID=UPI003FCD9B4A